MFNIPIAEILGKLPVTELYETLQRFCEPLTRLLPDRRLRKTALLAVQGILAGESPVVTEMAQSVSRLESDSAPVAKRLYRFLGNARFDHQTLLQGLYQVARDTVDREQKPRLVVAVDPVNLEKPYTQALEGVSVVRKSTPPDLKGQARLTPGYPAITATVVNTQVPAISYANWFSYTQDFISENEEVRHALRATRRLFPGHHLRFVGDAGLDDRKVFAWIAEIQSEFVIRAWHLERGMEVYNPHLDRWEPEQLADLVDTIPWQATWRVAFTHAGKTRLARVRLGWLLCRLPDTQQQLWLLVAQRDEEDKPLVLLTNVPLKSLPVAQEVYQDWRLRTRIEHGYRFDQEQGLDMEDVRVRTLEGMRRVFALVLLAAQFVFFVAENWPPPAVHWLRQLGGQLYPAVDRGGPYILLRGLVAVHQTLATLTQLSIRPFPHQSFTYG